MLPKYLNKNYAVEFDAVSFFPRYFFWHKFAGLKRALRFGAVATSILARNCAAAYMCMCVCYLSLIVECVDVVSAKVAHGPK